MRGMFAAVSAVLLGMALALPAAGEAMTPYEKELYEAARKEGEITWYSAQLGAEASEAVGAAFTERYPGVKVNVVRSTAQVAFQRLSQDMRAGVAQADVFSSTDYGHATFLKREGHLLSYRPKNADGMMEAFRNADPDDMFHINHVGLVLIAYNKDKLSEAEAPKSWKELTDPKWKDKIAVGHPGFSGYVGTWAVMLRKLYGWKYFEALEKNNPQIGRSIQDTVTMLNAGERVVGASPSATSLISISRGNPIGLIYPTDGTLMVPSPTAILKKAPHPNAAKLFLEFVTSPHYYRVSTKFFSESLRPEVPPPAGARPLDQIKLIRPTDEEIETGIPEVKELWRDTFGI
jgi:iron(III) transport system substrate-binding protein